MGFRIYNINNKGGVGTEFMKFYVLNTNKRQHKQCEEDMIKNQTASAYGIQWGNSIKK